MIKTKTLHKGKELAKYYKRELFFDDISDTITGLFWIIAIISFIALCSQNEKELFIQATNY